MNEKETKKTSKRGLRSEAPVAEETMNVPVEGVVVNCQALNVRKEAKIDDGNILGHINKDSTVQIDMSKSTSNYFYVCSASGLEGFCKKEFIKTK